MRIGLLLFCICISACSFGQVSLKEGCLLNLYSQEQYKIDKGMAGAGQEILRVTEDEVLVLPVVFHVIHQYGDENISDGQVLQALNALNDGFANVNVFDQGSGVNTNIRFCLVKQDENGHFTTGINHVYADLPEIIPEVHDGFLKSLINWDPDRYINIWVVKEITGFKEEQDCGFKKEHDIAGYATLPGAHGTDRDGIVVEAASIQSTIIHEMGHYLGLYHTFSGCTNNDCSIDGDMVCDTPPQGRSGAACDGSSNTCNTDDQSGFSTDQNDLPYNFMDYTGCPHDFTPGQKERMRYMVLNVRNSLLNQTTCEIVCQDPEEAEFTFPVINYKTGDPIHFTNTSTGNNYEWYINDQLISTSTDLDYIFLHQGWFKIELVARSSNPDACSNRQVNWIRVYCAIRSLISVSKNKVDINEPVLFSADITELTPDNSPVLYQWYQNGEAFSNVPAPTYKFQTAGDKIIYLVTRKGTCTDTSNYKLVRVKPLPDYTLRLNEISCSEAGNKKIVFTICNEGHKDLPAGLPVSFYHKNPTSENAQLIGTVFLTDKGVGAYCCESFEMEIPNGVEVEGHYIYAVINDDASLPTPYQFTMFPVTGLPESVYENNIDSLEWVPFTVTVAPKDTMVLLGTVVDLTATVSRDSATIRWVTTKGQLSCDTCLTTRIMVEGYTVIIVSATSKDGCIDTDTAFIRISIEQDILIPSAFTPNKDFKNDWFYVLGNTHVARITRMAVFNRWGEKVFERSDFDPNIPELGWDGKYKERDAALATYVYYVAVEFLDGSRKTYKGTVILVR